MVPPPREDRASNLVRAVLDSNMPLQWRRVSRGVWHIRTELDDAEAGRAL